MNCSDCEQLFDAYLDGHLAGSLRLEFDAHRLRCRRCQQTLAMLEAIGNVVTEDPQVPELSLDFTDRVMRQITAPQRKRLRPSLRVAMVAGAVLQAAAVLTFAILVNRSQPAPPSPAVSGQVPPNPIFEDPQKAAWRKLIIEKIEQRAYEARAAGESFSSELASVARYPLDITLPADVVGEKATLQMASIDPIRWFLDSILPAETGSSAKPEEPAGEEVHSL